jgi:hypothetical protein
MGEFLEAAFISGLMGAMMRMATPIIFATLGEILAERSGVLNLGIEGTMLMGAMTGFLVTFGTGSLWLGVLMAAIVGMILGLLMAFLSVNLGLSQHVSGLGITLFSTGLAMFIYRLYFGSPTVPPIVTRKFYGDLYDRYQGTPLCWVGDIGDSIYKPEQYLMETLEDMLNVGMDPEREDFSLWSPIVRSDHFLTQFEASRPKIFSQVARYFTP